MNAKIILNRAIERSTGFSIEFLTHTSTCDLSRVSEEIHGEERRVRGDNGYCISHSAVNKMFDSVLRIRQYA